MCGIAGIVAKNTKDTENRIVRMVQSLKHRGGDSTGKCFFNSCALGHTRLSIVDHKSGQQPMFLGRKKAIVFNGEIYGYQNIKKDFNDFDFKTTSDTELILALFQKYKFKMLDKLPGMYSFAIWNDDKEELFCARDRFGEKPFYYAVGKNKEFIFASEIKSIIASGLVEPIIDRKSLSHYFKKLYISPTTTIYKNIFILPPAHFLKYADNKISIERYWSLPIQEDNINIDEVLDKFKFLLDRAVKKCMVADVPVGAFLSGGLDSSTIVALASKYSDKIKTFSFGMEGATSELSFAKRIAVKYNTDHIELYEKNIDYTSVLFKMQEVYDEPFADSSNIPTFLMSKLARKHTKVVLTGDGADELLGGYSQWYRELCFMEKCLGRDDRKLAAFSLILRIMNKFTMNKFSSLRYLKNGVSFASGCGSISQAHGSHNQYFSNSELSDLGVLGNANPNCKIGNESNTVDDAMRMDLLDYMPGDILVKTDRASMANSLELRSPFLDVDFASFCVSLPNNLKVTTRQDKIILRKAYSQLWTKPIRRRTKQGFGIKIENIMSKDSMKALKKEYLENKNKKIFDYLSYDNTQQYLEKNSYQTWILLNFSLWLDSHDYAIK